MPFRLVSAQIFSARVALLVALALVWLNYLLTARWETIPGSLHGSKEPWFLATLIVSSVAAWRMTPGPIHSRALGRAALAGGVAVLAGAFLVWFAPSTWTRIPFLDNWPARFQTTVDGVDLLRRGAVVGWEWAFLGGYHSSSDITQNLTILGALPMALLGDRVGFHILHLALFGAIPALVYFDLRHECPVGLASLATGMSCVLVANYSYFLLRSGDTNSLTGVFCAVLAIVANHSARRGQRWGGPLLLVALALGVYSHAGFFAYTVVYLLVEALYFKDRQSVARVAIAVAAAMVVALPLTWEAWRHPAYFIYNNVTLDPSRSFDGLAFARSVYYNVEILVRPGRWFNDYTGLTVMFAPVFFFVALRAPGRAGFYAWAALATLALTRLDDPQLGYLLSRPIHMYVVFAGPVLGWFLLTQAGTRVLAVALTVLVGIYVQIAFFTVPHVESIRDFDAALVDRIASLDGNLVLLENSPHRNMNATPGRRTEPTPFRAHFEALLPGATGQRFYAGLWDGWQWSPYRHQVLAGGAFQGHSIEDVRTSEVAAELRRWGIRHLLVWSAPAKQYLDRSPEFARRWDHGLWAQYEFATDDVRSVVTSHGAGRLAAHDPLGARIALSDVEAGDMIVVRTNFHPAWTARAGTRALEIVDVDGQIGFRAPATGSYDVTLEYPRRRGLLALAIVVLAAVAAVLTRWPTVPYRKDRDGFANVGGR